MARDEANGSVWGRPEAVDTLGRRPGRRRRTGLLLLGAVCLALGAYLGVSAPSSAAVRPQAPASVVDPDASYDALVARPTCASIAVVVPAARRPAQGIPENVVVALYRADADGGSQLLVPRSHVLTSQENRDGSLNLTVLVRIGSDGDDRQVAEVTGASAAGALAPAVLYDVDPIEVLDECRGA